MSIDWDIVLSRTVHDVRTQVRNGRTNLQLLQRELGEAADAVAPRLTAISESQQSLDRLTSRLERLLEATRAEKAQLWSDVRELGILLLAAKLDQDGLLKQTQAEVTISPVPKILLPGKLQSVFAELLENAARSRQPERPLRITVEAAQPTPQSVCVTVRDNGMGWDAAYSNKLFSPFERLRGGGPGFGLGLATCRVLVEAAGGHIGGEPVAEGAVFTVQMPVSAD